MRQNFKDIDIFAGFGQQNGQDWQKANGITANWRTPEQIDIQPVYTKEDLEGMEHLDFAAGIPPFLRGPYSMGDDKVDRPHRGHHKDAGEQVGDAELDV